ncbi:sigma-70 family RNA polymerase sigma factor [uncultured Maribacter sp.]|uniref:RNA polymerase sigma factor n=1 Tax=uncultured Maribacter sp. TaxID=431308 RepID=UPI00263857F4|nr:sigma-70 family RNA polymerase sigma factor [uncultured Maribacter sp.]
MEISTEKSLWYLFIEGDLNAFSSLFKHFYPMLYNYGLKISGNTELTEDSLQSFFVYLHEHRHTIGKVSNIKAYLFISYRRNLLNNLKKERKYTTYDDSSILESNFSLSIEELSSKQETFKLKSAILLKLLNSLSAREREAIYLKYYSNLNTKEIADVMDITYQSVLNTLQKAFTKLRNKSESRLIQNIINT